MTIEVVDALVIEHLPAGLRTGIERVPLGHPTLKINWALATSSRGSPSASAAPAARTSG